VEIQPQRFAFSGAGRGRLAFALPDGLDAARRGGDAVGERVGARGDGGVFGAARIGARDGEEELALGIGGTV
jgi:hypothetical protein